MTANDPGDADAGGNHRQNSPVPASARSGRRRDFYVTGSLDSAAAGTFRVEFFSTPACNALGQGEGETFLGATNVATDLTGQAVFALIVSGAAPVGAVVAAGRPPTWRPATRRSSPSARKWSTKRIWW